VLATFLLLTCAILALWVAPRRVPPSLRGFLWLPFFAAALIAAMLAGIVRAPALVWIAALALAAHCFCRRDPRPGWSRTLAAAALLLLGAGLMAHLLPGFENPRVVGRAVLTAGSVPYSLHLNFDKAVFGIVFLGWCHARISRWSEWGAMLRAAAPVAGGFIGGIMLLALALGYVRFEPKFPAIAWLWMWGNLFVTCLAEEALFRGFVQAELQRRWSATAGGRTWALVVAATLFGLAHIAGGWVYVGLSTVAGLGYGLAYQRSGDRIEAGILTHFALNALHFFFFTYPALAPVP
jgi:uncharacterized protein